MLKQIRNLAFCIALGVTPLCFSPVLAHAQHVDEDQRAYQVGYQNGVNDAQRNRAMNLNTDDWHGDRLNIYQRGYREGYDSVKGYGRDHEHDANRGVASFQGEDRRAYESGYQRGINDAQARHAMNMNTGDWKADRLQAYQQGYQEGYRSVAGEHGWQH